MPKENTIQESSARNRLTVTSSSSSSINLLSHQLIPQRRLTIVANGQIYNALLSRKENSSNSCIQDFIPIFKMKISLHTLAMFLAYKVEYNIKMP
jgi:hypothetical protein